MIPKEKLCSLVASKRRSGSRGSFDCCNGAYGDEPRLDTINWADGVPRYEERRREDSRDALQRTRGIENDP